jgi:hypothetical protein
VPGREWSASLQVADHVYRYFTDEKTLGGHALFGQAVRVLKNPTAARALVAATVGTIVAEKAHAHYDPANSRAPAHGACPLTAYLKASVFYAALKEKKKAEIAALPARLPAPPKTPTEEALLVALASDERLQRVRAASPGEVVSFCVAFGRATLDYRRKVGNFALQDWADALRPFDELLVEQWLRHAQPAVRGAAAVALGRRGHPVVLEYLAHLQAKNSLLLRQAWYGIGLQATCLPSREELGAALGLSTRAKPSAVGKWLNHAAAALERVLASRGEDQ